MIKFKCYRSPRERLGIWLQQEREYPHYILENIADLLKEWSGIDDYFTPKNLPNREYFRRAKAYLQEKGEDKATVFLLRSPIDHRILHGSTRIPLKVETKEGVYIIKPYDDYDSELEKKVLQAVSGKIGPQVLHLGQDFYSEELINFSRYTNLWDKCFATGAFSQEKRKELWEYWFRGKGIDLKRKDKLMNEMVEAAKPMLLEGARMHAELAKLGVIYDHNHWLDEFHIANDSKPMITDFGTSYLFLNPFKIEEELPKVSREYEEAKEKFYQGYTELREDGVNLAVKEQRMKSHQQTYQIVQDRSRTPISESTIQRLGSRAKEVLSALKFNPGLTTNLLLAEESAQEGIERFFERAAVGSGYDYLKLIRGDFKAEFFKHYYS
ncbi:MAG: hypothetical protein AABY40_02430 [Nanoarchaeota archaeon]